MSGGRLSGLRWALHEFLVQPYSPFELITRDGRMRHHLKLREEQDQRVLDAAKKLGIALARTPGGDYLAYSGALVDRDYEHPGFEPHGVIVDVGAQFGDYSLLCARCFNAEVVAFEPLPDNFRILEENLRLNGVQGKVRAFLKAVGKSTGTSELRYSKDMARPDGANVTPAEVVALDTLDLRPTIIKIDVEGMEMEVLEGARATIDRWSPKMIVETHSKSLRRSVDAFLGNLGYRCLFIDAVGRSHQSSWMDEQTNRFYLREGTR